MTTSIGVVRESGGEHRVALTPDGAGRLTNLGLRVLVEAGAGKGAWFDDADYVAAGAAIGSREQAYAEGDVILCVQPPPDIASARAGSMVVGLLGLLADPALAGKLAAAGVTAVGVDLLPRTLSRAQGMDALTSQANVAGYKAVLVAAAAYGGYLPMLMTAAGTSRPAQVLVLGAGVAGLQAIATARRLGAMVTGYDVREAARADICSTGATVLDLGTAAGTGEGGYARQLTDDEARAQQRALDAAIARFDIVITTAQLPGRKPPLLVTEDAVDRLRPGSVVVDLAAGDLGGNVAGSRPDSTTVTAHGVTVIGAGNLPASVPRAASTAYARNLCALLPALVPLDLADEIQAAVVVTHGGAIVHPKVRAALDKEEALS
jgi:H+-translocating NAD(P) transhydrogenase subunit alpha